MVNETDCTDGACAIDYKKEVAPKEESIFKKKYLIPLVSFLFLIVGIALAFFKVPFFKVPISIIWFGLLYIAIGGPIILKA